MLGKNMFFIVINVCHGCGERSIYHICIPTGSEIMWTFRSAASTQRAPGSSFRGFVCTMCIKTGRWEPSRWCEFLIVLTFYTDMQSVYVTFTGWDYFQTLQAAAAASLSTQSFTTGSQRAGEKTKKKKKRLCRLCFSTTIEISAVIN